MTRSTWAAVGIATLLALSSCSNSTKIVASAPTDVESTDDTTTTTPIASTSSLSTDTAAPVTTAPPTTAPPTTAPPTTAPLTTAPPTTAPPTTAIPSGPCGGPATVPATAADVIVIHGDIDGDLAPDTVTSYSLAGIHRLHAKLAAGGESDTLVDLTFPATVSIAFEDIDHSAGAATPPPVAVIVVAKRPAGSPRLATFGFFTLTTASCIRQWREGSQPAVFPVIRNATHLAGLQCDGAAGSIHYVLNDAVKQGDGTWKVSSRELNHNFTSAQFDDLGDTNVPDTPGVPKFYGDITNCGHPLVAP